MPSAATFPSPAATVVTVVPFRLALAPVIPSVLVALGLVIFS